MKAVTVFSVHGQKVTALLEVQFNNLCSRMIGCERQSCRSICLCHMEKLQVQHFFFNCGYLQWLLGLKKRGKIHHVQYALLRSLGGSMHTDVTPRQQLTIKPASKPRTISKYWPHTQIGNYCLACCLLPITVQTIHWGKRWVLPISKSLSLKYFPASLSPATEK